MRCKAGKVERFDEELRGLVEDLVESMHASSGVGLAAEQIGDTRAVCVIDVPAEADRNPDDGSRENPDVTMPLVLINPVITGSGEDTVRAEEGCLSFPEIYAPVDRAYEITVSYADTDGEPRSLALKGLVARAAQHEIDHLNGVLLVDRISPVKRAALSGKLKRLKQQTRNAAAGA